MNKKNTIIKQYNVIKSHKNTANIYNPKKKKNFTKTLKTFTTKNRQKIL